jgi:hypothetical protein
MHEPAQLVEASANRAELLLTVSAYRQKFTDILLGAGLEESSAFSVGAQSASDLFAFCNNIHRHHRLVITSIMVQVGVSNPPICRCWTRR